MRRTRRRDVLGEFADALRAAPRSVRGLGRDTRGARRRTCGLAANLQRAAHRPGRRVRGEGASPTVRWCCPRTRSMARLQRPQLSAAVSSVKNGAAICQAGRSLFRTERERTPRTVDGSDGGAPTTRRARSSLASETHTKRNAPRRHTHRVTPPPVAQAAATPSWPSTRTGAGPLMCGS